MNRIFFTLLCLGTFFTVTAQTFQGTIKPGTTASSVILAIKPSANYSDKPSNVQLTIAIPQSVGTRPTMNIITNNYSSLFSTVATFSNATFGSDYIYLINMITPTLTTTKNYVANTEDIVAEVGFTGNVGSIANIRLVQLPNGTATGGAGSENGNYNFYTEFAVGGDKTNQTAMFYSTTGGTVVNNPLGYGGLSTVSAGSGTVPLSWLSFGVQKQKENALLNWTVANQVNADYFDIEAGVEANKLSAIGKVQSTTSGNYSFLHKNYIALSGRNIFYRIKQVDKDGKFTYSQTVKLNLDKEFAFNLIGNPVTTKDIKIALQSPSNNRGTISIVDLNGKQLSQENISWSEGYSEKLISLPELSKGVYFAVLQTGDQQYRVQFVR